MPIHQEVTIVASPRAIFDILTSSDRFAKMTGGRPADISKEAGGAFALFGGDIEGRNIELVPGKRVVQAWRSCAWPEGVFSLVTFQLNASGSTTTLVFDQVGYPESGQQSLTDGWHQMYWGPMNKMLGS